MATVNTYRVVFHVELNGQKQQQCGDRQAHISAANNDPATLITALDNNSLASRPANSVVVFDSIANWGAGSAFN